MDTKTSYDRVAAEYVRRICDELKDNVRNLGVACDIGCGPGHVAHYLHERGVKICGVDTQLRW
jgi:2-polyprenyl-3-methyl-5-hydroxy-6-metoxy-1,4-benzoquinol methylase